MKKTSLGLKKKVLLSVLMAAVVGMSNSALAADYGDLWNPSYNEITDTLATASFVGRGDYNTLSFTGKGSVTVDGASISAWRVIEALNANTGINFGTDPNHLEQLTIKSTTSGGNDKYPQIMLIADGAFINVYSQKFTLNAENNIGATVEGSNSKLNIVADEFTANANGYALRAFGGGSINVKAENVNISSTSDAGILAVRGNVDISAKDVDITSTSDAAIWVQNNTDGSAAPENAASISIKADTIDLKGANIGVAAFSNGQLSLNGDTTIEATNAIDVRGNSTVNINTDGAHTTVIKGDVVFETPATAQNSHNSGKIINAIVNLNLTGEGSSWTGTAYQEYKSSESDQEYTHSVELNENPYQGNVTGFAVTIADGAAWNMTGNSFVNNATVKDGGSINVQENVTTFNAAAVELNDASLNLEGANQKVTINKLNGTGGTINTDSLYNKVSVGTKDEDTTLNVNGGSTITDAIASGKASLDDLAGIVTTNTGDSEKTAANSVTTDANDINGGYSAVINSDGKVAAGSVKTYENSTNRAVSDMASLSLMTWRQENNDMNKRLGELRDSKGQHGAWARMARGETKYGSQSVKNQYNYYQVGYDEKLSVNPNWTVGVALTRTEGSSSFSTGSGENKHTGVALYGSYLADNGSFIDLVAKYARMDNEYKTIGAAVGDADYETNGYSLSAEYGKRFTKASGLWLEPQVELTYGKVSSASYITSKGASVRQEGMDSLVARLGFALGQNFKHGNAYVRASYLYDFDGETDVTMSKAGAGSYKYAQDLGGGWWEVGVGTNINLSEATHLYFDVEKTYGGSVATPWQWNAGIRYSF